MIGIRTANFRRTCLKKDFCHTIVTNKTPVSPFWGVLIKPIPCSINMLSGLLFCTSQKGDTEKFFKKMHFYLVMSHRCPYLCPAFEKQGTLAQMVEQWTENPCVPSSILGGTTINGSGRSFVNFLSTFSGTFLNGLPFYVFMQI